MSIIIMFKMGISPVRPNFPDAEHANDILLSREKGNEFRIYTKMMQCSLYSKSKSHLSVISSR